MPHVLPLWYSYIIHLIAYHNVTFYTRLLYLSLINYPRETTKRENPRKQKTCPGFYQSSFLILYMRSTAMRIPIPVPAIQPVTTAISVFAIIVTMIYTRPSLSFHIISEFYRSSILFCIQINIHTIFPVFHRFYVTGQKMISSTTVCPV